MRRDMLLGASVALLALGAGAAKAADITYTGQQQVGDTAASYSFTTDGETGIGFSLVNYEVTLSDPSYLITLTPTNSHPVGEYFATSSGLSATTFSDFAIASNSSGAGGALSGLLEFDQGLTHSQTASDTTVDVAYSVASNDPFATAAAPPTVSAAPEPGVWALMMLGVGGMGLMLRRRRSTGTLAAA